MIIGFIVYTFVMIGMCGILASSKNRDVLGWSALGLLFGILPFSCFGHCLLDRRRGSVRNPDSNFISFLQNLAHGRTRIYYKMKELLGTTAVIVIATCGYFVYDNIRTKQLIKARLEYQRCMETLESTKEYYVGIGGDWDNDSIEQRHSFLVENIGNLIADIFVDQWEQCGPI